MRRLILRTWGDLRLTAESPAVNLGNNDAVPPALTTDLNGLPRVHAFDEMLRIIREEEPPKPSIRLGTSYTLPSAAANRQIEPKRLSTLVRGELDCIVMKALEKDRTRRYETANGFARDIRRYLNDEPVEACKPSAGYRLRVGTRPRWLWHLQQR